MHWRYFLLLLKQKQETALLLLVTEKHPASHGNKKVQLLLSEGFKKFSTTGIHPLGPSVSFSGTCWLAPSWFCRGKSSVLKEKTAKEARQHSDLAGHRSASACPSCLGSYLLCNPAAGQMCFQYSFFQSSEKIVDFNLVLSRKVFSVGRCLRGLVLEMLSLGCITVNSHWVTGIPCLSPVNAPVFSARFQSAGWV